MLRFFNPNWKLSLQNFRTLLIILVLIFSFVLLSACAAREVVPVKITSGLFSVQSGVRVSNLGNTPDDTQEEITLSLNSDGYETELAYSVVKRGSRIIPIYKPGKSNDPEKPLTAIGTSNRYILEYGISMYIVDFDKMTISKFLADETDGLKFEAVKKAAESEGNFLYWAANPQVSSDGSLMLYYSNREAPRSDIRMYNFITGEDKILTNISSFADEVIWNGYQSVITREMNNLVEISLSEQQSVKNLFENVEYWDGSYPNILFRSEKNQLILFNAKTNETSELITFRNTCTDIAIACGPEPGSANALVWQNCTDHAELSLIRFDDSKIISLIKFDQPFLVQSLQWVSSTSALISGTLDEEDKTYEIDLADFLK